MLKNPLFWYGNMAVAVFGWVFFFFGLIVGVGAGFPKTLWMIVAVCWVIGHPLELLLAVPIGDKAGVPKSKSVMKTLAFGFTWWLPLKMGVFND